jgi:5-dehydro-2-deoxygluconokinase
VILDIDYRAAAWSNMRGFGVAVRTLARLADLVIGTEQEVVAAGGEFPVESAAHRLLDLGPSAIALKRGPAGATIWQGPRSARRCPAVRGGDSEHARRGRRVRERAPLRLPARMALERAARLANASGAIVAGRHGCSSAMPR